MVGGIGKLVKDAVGKPTGFRSEYQKQAPWTDHGPERLRPTFGKHRHLILLRRRIFQKIVKVIPDAQPDIFPVVKSGSFDLTAFK